MPNIPKILKKIMQDKALLMEAEKIASHPLAGYGERRLPQEMKKAAEFRKTYSPNIEAALSEDFSNARRLNEQERELAEKANLPVPAKLRELEQSQRPNEYQDYLDFIKEKRDAEEAVRSVRREKKIDRIRSRPRIEDIENYPTGNLERNTEIRKMLTGKKPIEPYQESSIDDKWEELKKLLKKE